MQSSDFPIRRHPSAHQIDVDLVEVLDRMLQDNERISLRSVISHLEGIGQPSSISRDEWRSGIMRTYQDRQCELRALMERADKTSKSNVVGQLNKAKERIRELETQVEMLTASHKALILAVGQIGGMSAWKGFYEHYQSIIYDLKRLGAIPSAEVVRWQPEGQD